MVDDGRDDECFNCNGTGKVFGGYVEKQVIRMEVPCVACGGSGRLTKTVHRMQDHG